MNSSVKYVLMLIFAVAMFSCSSRDDIAILKGNTCDYKGKGQLLLDYRNSTGNHRDTVQVDGNGNFAYRLVCHEPMNVYLYLKYLGDSMARVPAYIVPGVELTVKMHGEMKMVEFYGNKKERYVVTPTFTGKTARESDYLNLPYKSFDSVDNDGITPLTYKEFSSNVADYQQYLADKLKSCCQSFKDEQQREIEGMQMEQIFIYGSAVARLGYELTGDEDFMGRLKDINVEDTVNCSQIGSLSDRYIRMNLILYPELYEGEKEIVRYMKYLRDKVSNTAVRERLSDYNIQSMIQFGRTDGLNEAFEIYRDLSGRSEIFKNNEKAYNGIKNIMPGLPAPDFLVEDIKGNTLHFKDIIGKGKVVYVDFWATWCAPCCAEIPNMERLARIFKDNPNIVLISISVDKDYDKWKEKVVADNPEWPQYIVSQKTVKEFDSIYNIIGIPRFMLLDKSGCFIDNNTIRPSYEKSEDYLMNYLK